MKPGFAALCAGAMLLACTRASAAADIVPAPGVHPYEIVVGSVLDLSGPLATEGIAIRNGLTLAFDDINAHGGIMGRKIRLIAKDSAYDPDKARGAAATLLKTGIFAMIGANGTPPVSAIRDQVRHAGLLDLFPSVPARVDYGPPQRLEFEMELPVVAQVQIGLKALLDERGSLRVAVLYRQGTFGRAALKGAARELARRGLKITKAMTYTPGELDLSQQIQALHEEGTELIVLGAVPQEALRAMTEAGRQHWHPIFLCPSACYMPEVATLGGRTANGLYAVTTTPIPYPDTRNAKLRAWVSQYEHRFHAVASAQALHAYLAAHLFAEALRRAGPHPTPLYVARVLENMPAWKDPAYDSIAVDYTAHDHIGLHSGLLAQIVRGRWHIVSDALSLPPP